MHSLSALTIAQLLLILVGLIFQVVAMSWLYKDSSGERSDGEHDDWADRKINLSLRRRPGRMQQQRRDTVHDYYEMEKTPPGVRPADLRKTARVTYMDNVNAPRSEEHGEAQAGEAHT
ncbi:MAG TPA: hypothetical protein VHY09_01225 [Candidatus Methylacidiphilales bacterium]|jgi:hypothetical protein|nr:hypothetical protein [Candidatus Methylacidiphilales bacterium]